MFWKGRAQGIAWDRLSVLHALCPTWADACVPIDTVCCACMCETRDAMGKDYFASIPPQEYSMNFSEYLFDFNWRWLPQASLSRLLCDLCSAQGDQGSFAFKPGQRWKDSGSKISCGVRREHQRGTIIIVSWKTRKRESVSNVTGISLWRVQIFEKLH